MAAPNLRSTLTIPSAAAPLQNASTALLKVYDEHGIYGIMRNLDLLVDDLKTSDRKNLLELSRISVARTVASFAESNHRAIFEVIAAISPLALRAILSGTVAHAIEESPVDPWYGAQGPGVYVIGLSIAGRRGRFLSGNELARLRAMMERYCSGYLEAIQHRPDESNPDLRFLRSVEAGSGPFKNAPSRCISGQDDLRRVQVLKRRLGERCNSVLDPTGNVEQVQSPLYVGCSDRLEQRLEDYRQLRLASMNKLLVLTMMLVKEMGLDPRLRVRPVMRVWEANQLQLAERVVSLLASSLVAQDGFNATEPGGKQSDPAKCDYDAARDHVFRCRPFMQGNLDALNGALERRAGAREELKTLADQAESLRGRLEDTEATQARVKARAKELSQPEKDPETEAMDTKYVSLAKMMLKEP